MGEAKNSFICLIKKHSFATTFATSQTPKPRSLGKIC